MKAQGECSAQGSPGAVQGRRPPEEGTEDETQAGATVQERGGKDLGQSRLGDATTVTEANK